MLDGYRSTRGIDGLLDGDNVHADACASGRDHRRCLGERALGRLLEELGEHRMLVQLAHAHVEELGRARHEHGKHPLLGARGVFPVVLKQAGVAHVVEHLFDLSLRHARQLDHLGQSVGPAHLHLKQDICLLVGRRLGKRPILVAQQLVAVEQTIRAVLAELHNLLARMLGQWRYEFRADIGLGIANPRSIENHDVPPLPRGDCASFDLPLSKSSAPLHAQPAKLTYCQKQY